MTDATNTIAIGTNAGAANTSADGNVIIGTNSGDAITSSPGNTLVGNNAGSAISTGNGENICVGNNAGAAMTTGQQNIIIGDNAAAGAAVTSSGNTIVGDNAGYDLTTGSNNTACGVSALNNVSTGATNTAIGANAGLNISTGSNNTILGQQCGDNITTGTYNICIGVLADPSAVDGDFQIVMGSAIAGTEDYQFSFGTTNSVVTNEFDTDAAWTRTSDRRKKRNIQEDKLGLNFINDLKTVTYQWRPSNEYPKEWNEYSEESNVDTDTVMHGMIAQDIKQALDNAECDTFAGWKERKDGSQVMSREMFVIPLIKAVQELSEKNDELQKRLDALEA